MGPYLLGKLDDLEWQCNNIEKAYDRDEDLEMLAYATIGILRDLIRALKED